MKNKSEQTSDDGGGGNAIGVFFVFYTLRHTQTKLNWLSGSFETDNSIHVKECFITWTPSNPL